MLINILAITFGVIFVITVILAFIYGDVGNSKIKKVIFFLISFLIGIIVSPSILLVGYMFNSIISS